MAAKNVLTTAALTSALLLAACSSDEESTKESEENETVEAAETENIYDKDGELVAETTVASDSENKPNGSGDYKSKNDPRLMIPAGYEGFTKTLENFDLPEEGRLTKEEAEEELGYETKRGFPVVAYENGMIFHKNAKVLASQVWVDGERPYPYGTQVLAFFKTVVKTAAHDLQQEGTGQGIELKPLEEYSKSEREYIADGHGWDILKQKNEYALEQFRQFETYFDENGYDELASWATVTVDHFEKAASLGRSDWEEAYDLFYQGTSRVFKMDQSIPNQYSTD
jgi:hypothetical protein